MTKQMDKHNGKRRNSCVPYKKLHDSLDDVVLIHVQTCVYRLQISHFNWSTINEIHQIESALLHSSVKLITN